MVRERRGRLILSAVAIFLTALALQRACTQPWGRGAGATGEQYEISAVGLSRLGGAASAAASPAAAPRTDCRWWPVYGDPVLCGPRGTDNQAYRSLRQAYPLLQVALWLSVASLLLQALRVPRQRLAQGAVPALVSALTTAGILFVVRGARDGLAALEGVAMSFSGAGFIMAVVAAVMSAASAVVLLRSFTAAPRT